MQTPESIRNLALLDRDLIEQRIHDLLRLRAVGDISGMARYAAPDLVIKSAAGRAYPFHTHYVGLQQCVEFGRAVHIAYENLGSTVNKLLIDGECAALQRTARIRNRGAGRTIEVDFWDFFKFRDGLIVEFAEYPDTAAFSQLESAA